MTDWVCPNCRGGFPAAAAAKERRLCPWCGQSIDKTYEYEPEVRIARTDETDDQRSLLGFLR